MNSSLISEVEHPFLTSETDKAPIPDSNTPIRSAGFRQAIMGVVRLYLRCLSPTYRYNAMEKARQTPPILYRFAFRKNDDVQEWNLALQITPLGF